jgi:hypothetical protein
VSLFVFCWLRFHGHNYIVCCCVCNHYLFGLRRSGDAQVFKRLQNDPVELLPRTVGPVMILFDMYHY